MFDRIDKIGAFSEKIAADYMKQVNKKKNLILYKTTKIKLIFSKNIDSLRSCIYSFLKHSS